MTDGVTLNSNLSAAADSVRRAIDVAAQDLVERRPLIELVALAAVAREHLLVIGPPGTAKSAAARRMARALGGRYFEYLLGRFTEPSEIFGPVDLRKLREGVFETQTTGMLPEAEVAFLDEVFLGSTAILNTLLSLLNERVFRRGSSELQVPLRVCIAAANALPDEPSLSAFADRFLLRIFIEPIADAQLEVLLESGWDAERDPPQPLGSLAEIDALARAARSADLTPVRPLLAEAVRKLRAAGIALSDRRIVKLQLLAAAAATLDGRARVSAADLWPLVFALPGADSQALGREVLANFLSESNSRALAAAAEDASQSPLLRAERLRGELEAVLQLPAAERDPATQRLRIEALLRELDASFARDRLPEALAAVRARAVEALSPETRA